MYAFDDMRLALVIRNIVLGGVECYPKVSRHEPRQAAMTRWLKISALTGAVVAAGWVVWALSRDDYGAPTEDTSSSTGYYIPANLADALVEFDRMLGDRGRAQVLEMESEDEMVLFHFSAGMWMRNNWSLWSGSRLAQYFIDLGIQHPDNMSGIILISYRRQAHGLPVDLEGQVIYFNEYREGHSK